MQPKADGRDDPDDSPGRGSRGPGSVAAQDAKRQSNGYSNLSPNHRIACDFARVDRRREELLLSCRGAMPPIEGSDVNFLHTTFSVRRGPASWVVDPERSLRCTRRSGPLSIRDGPLHPPNFTPRRNPCQPHPHLATNKAGSAYSRDLPARTANQFHPRSGMLLHLADYRPWQGVSTTISDHPTRSRRPWKCRSAWFDPLGDMAHIWGSALIGGCSDGLRGRAKVVSCGCARRPYCWHGSSSHSGRVGPVESSPVDRH